MARFFTIRHLALLAFVQVLTSVEIAQANSIQINLGPSPALSTDLAIPFSSLNGTTLSGQNLSLNFVFSSPEFVRLFSVTSDFEVSVKLHTNSLGSVGFADGTGFLSDQLGNPLQPPQVLGSASSGGSMIVGLFPLLPGSGAPGRPFDFFSVHFDLTLPNNSSFEITGSEFELLSFGLGGPFGVGPGVPNDIVPDAADAIYLLGMGFAGVLVARFRFA